MDCRKSFPIIDSSVSYDPFAVKKQFNFDNKCKHNLSINNRQKKRPPKYYLHASSACGAIKCLGGVPNFVLGGVLIFDLMPLGFGDEGLGGTAIDSLVRELLCWK